MGTPRCVTVRRIGFAERANISEVVHADRPRAWSVRGIDGPIRALADVSVTPLADVPARVTIAVDFEGHGLGKLLIPLAVRRQACAGGMVFNARSMVRRQQHYLRTPPGHHR